jgi:hypothetical protein
VEIALGSRESDVGGGTNGSRGGDGGVVSPPPPPLSPLLVPALDARARSSEFPLDPISILAGVAFSAPPRNPSILALLPSFRLKFVYHSRPGTELTHIYTTGI